MKKIKLLLLIGFTVAFSITNAQNQDTPEIEKNSISANILGTGFYVGVSYERVLFERVSAEVGIGVIGMELVQ